MNILLTDILFSNKKATETHRDECEDEVPAVVVLSVLSVVLTVHHGAVGAQRVESRPEKTVPIS